MKVAALFAENIRRPIEEIIKVDDLEDQRLLNEIKEYYPTASIQKQLRDVLKAYDSFRHGPTQDVGIWISGFFGAGKSSFAKLLGILLGDRDIGARSAVELFSDRLTDDEAKIFLRQIREHIPTHVVMFDILKTQLVGAKEHPVTTVFYKALLRSLDYPVDLQLAELEITLEKKGRLDDFKDKYQEVYSSSWRDDRKLIMIAHSQASRVLHELDPGTYPSVDSWSTVRPQVDLSPLFLAERVLELSEARAGGKNVAFVVDEVGQYVSQGLDRIADLNGLVESFAMTGEGRIWLAAVSQEKLEAILNVYESERNELVRLKDRFPHRVFLSSSDIREVASHRVLRKKAEADVELRQVYQDHAGRLKNNTKVVASGVEYPALTEDDFVKLYPLLPNQIDLLIDVINGLRSHSGMQTELGAGNRKIIGLAQQLLVHEHINLADQDVGVLVTLDQVYRLLERDLPMELKAEVEEIERQVAHPKAGQVARALALLQFVDPVDTTEQNLAAVLQPSVSADSVLPEVRDAVKTMLEARKIRRTETGLKIQSAAERSWDEERDGRTPTAGDRMRILKSVLQDVWGKGAQAPKAQLGGWKQFSAGLRVGSESLVEGQITFEVRLVDPKGDLDDQLRDARSLTQQPDQDEIIVWTMQLSDAAENAVTEVFRSDYMSRKTAATAEEERLIRDEKQRLRTADGDLKKRIQDALCSGRIFFRGNDRSPGDDATRVKPEAERVLGPALETIYHRFDEGDVRVTGRDAEAILTSDNLAALPGCYTELGVVRTIDNQTRIITDEGAVATVLQWIRDEADSGQAPSGKELEHHFKEPPFGWSIELLQLLVGTLLRAGAITITASSQDIKKAVSPEAKRELSNNTRFRGITIRPRKSGGVDPSHVREAGKHLEQRFGQPVAALTLDGVADAIRTALCPNVGVVEGALDTVRRLRLPGEETLHQTLGFLRSMREGDDETAVQVLLDSVEVVQKGLARANGVESAITKDVEDLLVRARGARRDVGPILRERMDAGSTDIQALEKLDDILSKETFYEELPSLREAAATVIDAFADLYTRAFAEMRSAYEAALEELRAAPGWAELNDDEKNEIAGTLRQRAETEPLSAPWREVNQLKLLEEQTNAAPALLDRALEQLRKAVSPQTVPIFVRSLVPPEIRDTEQLEQALESIRQAVEKELANKHPVALR